MGFRAPLVWTDIGRSLDILSKLCPTTLWQLSTLFLAKKPAAGQQAAFLLLLHHHQSAQAPLENDYVTPLSVDLAKEVKYKAEAAV